MCTCFEPRTFEFPLIQPLSIASMTGKETRMQTTESDNMCHAEDSVIQAAYQQLIRPVERLDACLIGQFCVVTYNGKQ